MIIQKVKQAIKRSEHFSKDLAFAGPFSPLGEPGLSYGIRNFCLLLDSPCVEESMQDRCEAEFYIVFMMAEFINRWIDNHKIEGDVESAWALAAFLSRARPLGDWEKLK